ncbi:MAG TPA: hypothetical protein VFE37_05350 [Chloroflexota bacterium]|nr:hypothetical protein [Chloroflexota bacterium]
MAVVLAGVGLFYWVARPPFLGISDQSIYVASAKAIATGHGYTLPMYPDQPPNTYFPPAYSLLLAIIWRIAPTFPSNIAILQLSSLFMAVALMITNALVLTRNYREQALTVVLALSLIATTPIALQLSTALGSDTLYGVLSLAAVACIGNGARRPGWLVLGSACAVAAFYTRTVGIALIFTLAVVGLQQWRRRARMHGACLLWPLAATLPWLAWTTQHGGAGYVQQWRDGVPGFFPPLTAPGTLLTMLGQNVLRGHDSLWNVAPVFSDLPVLGALLIGWVLLRAWQRWQQAGDITSCYLASYLILLLAWPWHVPGRFLWPVAALVAADALHGLQLGWTRLTRRWDRILPHGYLALVAGVLAFNAVVLGTAASNLRSDGWVGGPTPRSVYEAMFAAVTYLDAHAAPGAVLGTNRWDAAAWWWLYTGRPTLDSVARVDGQGAFFRGGKPAGDTTLVDYFIYQGDDGVPGVDDRPAVEAQLAQRGARLTPIYCAPVDTLCIYDWRAMSAGGAP